MTGSHDGASKVASSSQRRRRRRRDDDDDASCFPFVRFNKALTRTISSFFFPSQRQKERERERRMTLD